MAPEIALVLSAQGVTFVQKSHNLVVKVFDATGLIAYKSFTLDENLHKHINDQLADNIGRASDTP